MSEINFVIQDLQRRLSNMIKRGRVHSVDLQQTPPRVQVQYATDAVTGWLPWISGRASRQSRVDWEPISIGEQCLVLSECGELTCGVVVPALLDRQNAPVSVSADEHVSHYSDGTTLSYNRKTHTLMIDVKGDLKINASGNVDLVAGKDMNITAGHHIKVKGERVDLN